MSKGLTAEQTAGAIGNIMRESGGYPQRKQGRPESETMSASRIDIQGTIVASVPHGRIISHPVLHRRHSPVIIRQEDDRRRSLMDTYQAIVGKILYQSLVR